MYASGTLSALATLGVTEDATGHFFRDSVCHQLYWPIKSLDQLKEANGVAIVFADGSRLIRGGAAFVNAWNRALTLAGQSPLTFSHITLGAAYLNSLNGILTKTGSTTGSFTGAVIASAPILEPGITPANVLAVFAAPCSAASARLTYIPSVSNRRIATGTYDCYAGWGAEYNVGRLFGLVNTHMIGGIPGWGREPVIGPDSRRVEFMFEEGSSPNMTVSSAVRLCSAGQIYDQVAQSIEHRDKSEVLDKIAEARARMIARVPENEAVLHWLRFVCTESGAALIPDDHNTRTPRVWTTQEQAYDGFWGMTPMLSCDGAFAPRVTGAGYDSMGVVRAVYDELADTSMMTVQNHRNGLLSIVRDYLPGDFPFVDQSKHSVAKLVGFSAAGAAYSPTGQPKNTTGVDLAEHVGTYSTWMDTAWAAPDRAAQFDRVTTTGGSGPVVETDAQLETRLNGLVSTQKDLIEIPFTYARSAGPRLENLCVAFAMCMRNDLTDREAATLSAEAARTKIIADGYTYR